MAEEEARKPKKAAGAPTWMVTFADLMALLLTLFVLLLTFAEMDLEKYQQLAGSMKDAFGTSYITKLSGVIEIEGSVVRDKAAGQPTQEQQQEQQQVPSASALLNPEPAQGPLSSVPFAIDKEQGKPTLEEEIMAAIEQTMAQELGGTGIEVQRNGDEVVIRFPDKVAFPSGSAMLNAAIRPALERVAKILAEHPGEVVISGHTDNVPLSGGGQFASNWGLSAARATAVAELMLQQGDIKPERLSVTGHADTRPLAPNSSAAGRATNRRVEISILAPSADVGQELKDAAGTR